MLQGHDRPVGEVVGVALDVVFVLPDVSVQVAVLVVLLVLLDVIPQDRVRDVGVVRRSVVLLCGMVLLKRCVRGRPFLLRLLPTAVPVRVKVQPPVRGRGQERDSLGADDLEEEVVGEVVVHGRLDPALPSQLEAAVVSNTRTQGSAIGTAYHGVALGGLPGGDRTAVGSSQ